MSRALAKVALIAGSVALIATGVGAAAGAGLLTASTAAGAATATAISATAATITSAATLVTIGASVGAQLTAKKPAARGSASGVLIQTDAPQPCLIGRTFSGGVLRHDVGYGGKVGKVKNPYRGSPVVYSGCGPVEELESVQTDFTPISPWYAGFLYTDSQLGLTPEPAALTPQWPGMPNWTAAHKLSGQAAILWSFKFDKDGKRFASGLPPFGAIWKGVKVYDPRLDSTYPGGDGPQRITDEATWVWSENPALHALAYAYGRHQNGKKVFGIGLPATGIDLARIVAWANVCDANDWKVGGVIYEPADRWANLKDIMAAGAAEPVFAGGVLSVRYRAPMVALETVTEDDIADDAMSVTAMQSYRNRLNGLVPKYRSEEHNWEYVSAELVSVPAYVEEDGEEKVEERQHNLVQQGDQSAQLVAYELTDGREIGPIVLTLKPQWRRYRPGECLHLDLPSLDLDTDAIILSRDFDPGTMKVTLTFVGETPAKHAFALGQVAVAPPTPALGDPEERDTTIDENGTAPQIYPVGSEEEMLALSARQGDIAVRSDIETNFMHNGGATGTAADWSELAKQTSVASAEEAENALQLGAYTPSDIADLVARVEALETP
ncbi:hypothetical protein HNO88_000513 [Novosphingobium chloroacetimidivorans]|uniref:Tip attachment protein J domain-containing protein n=1 Tax=Novosphingobium chloroacetimidivorans TaxID=1428314 RepID=A0A7W7K7A5_9SPHN|nr:hypothetical protein [Novosphingobium chloroacetimidivorans]MBB4857206.1 hypothetical protein [Novosphingobium chloroacetimidivorans]